MDEHEFLSEYTHANNGRNDKLFKYWKSTETVQVNIHMQIIFILGTCYDLTVQKLKKSNHQNEVNSLLDFCKDLSTNLIFPSKVYIEHLR